MVFTSCMLEYLSLRNLLSRASTAYGDRRMVGAQLLQGLFVVGRLGAITASCIIFLHTKYSDTPGHRPVPTSLAD